MRGEERRGGERRGEEGRGGERRGEEGEKTVTYSTEFRMFLIPATSHICMG